MKIKNTIIVLIGVILILSVIYFSFSFGNTTLNINDWNKDSRFFAAFFLFIAGIVGAIAVIKTYLEDN